MIRAVDRVSNPIGHAIYAERPDAAAALYARQFSMLIHVAGRGQPDDYSRSNPAP